MLVGASSVAQLEENLAAVGHHVFTAEELAAIDRHAAESDINIWAELQRRVADRHVLRDTPRGLNRAKSPTRPSIQAKEWH